MEGRPTTLMEFQIDGLFGSSPSLDMTTPWGQILNVGDSNLVNEWPNTKFSSS